MDAPETHFATRPDGAHIAYQVVGRGPDVAFQLGWPSHLVMLWAHPAVAAFFGKLAAFSRLILFDRLGTGMSDRGRGEHTFEDWAQDIGVVLDACASERAFHFGCHFGGRLALMFAATYPERTAGVATFGSHPATIRDDDYPWGTTVEALDQVLQQMRTDPGEGRRARVFDAAAPSVAGDPASKRWWVNLFMSAVSPQSSQNDLRAMIHFDIRELLGSVHTPTLLMHRVGDKMADIRATRYMADRIPGAKVIEVPGSDHLPFFEGADTILADVEEFVTGTRAHVDGDRVLATVLFTDIVASTEHATRLGDREWTRLLDRHDAVISRELERHRGRRVNPTGDGVLATFDGPARAVRCAEAIVSSVRPLGVEVRAGLHTGEIERRGEDIGGIAVHIGQRVSSLAGPGEVLVSRTVTDLVAGSGIEFTERGEHELKGVSGKWTVYAVRP